MTLKANKDWNVILNPPTSYSLKMTENAFKPACLAFTHAHEKQERGLNCSTLHVLIWSERPSTLRPFLAPFTMHGVYPDRGCSLYTITLHNSMLLYKPVPYESRGGKFQCSEHGARTSSRGLGNVHKSLHLSLRTWKSRASLRFP